MFGTVVSLVAAAGIIGSIENISPHPFYDPPPLAAVGKPGELLRVEPMAGAPAGSAAYKVLYRSVGLKGEPVAISGMVIVPGTVPPPSGRPVVAWAHPTTGIARKCAPSLQQDAFAGIPGLKEMLTLGYVVTATDYQGLGTPGPHPYLIGVSEGRAVIDSVRAARLVPGAEAGTRYAAWGHSQGGQSAIYTDVLSREYAPELTLVGVAAAAPATDLGQLLTDDGASAIGKVLTAYALWSWSAIYDYNGGTVIEPAAFPVVEEIDGHCIENAGEDYTLLQIESQIKNGILTVDLDKTAPWDKLIAENSPVPQAVRAPVFIAQGLSDPIVVPAVTIGFAKAVCAHGGAVQLYEMPATGHAMAAVKSATQTVEWMAARFAGVPLPKGC